MTMSADGKVGELNVTELNAWLREEHGCEGGYKSVLRREMPDTQTTVDATSRRRSVVELSAE